MSQYTILLGADMHDYLDAYLIGDKQKMKEAEARMEKSRKESLD